MRCKVRVAAIPRNGVLTASRAHGSIIAFYSHHRLSNAMSTTSNGQEMTTNEACKVGCTSGPCKHLHHFAVNIVECCPNEACDMPLESYCNVECNTSTCEEQRHPLYTAIRVESKRRCLCDIRVLRQTPAEMFDRATDGRQSDMKRYYQSKKEFVLLMLNSLQSHTFLHHHSKR